MRLSDVPGLKHNGIRGVFAAFSVAAFVLTAILAAPGVASAQQFSFDRPGSNAAIFLRPGSIVTAPNTLVPRFGSFERMRHQRGNPVGPPMLIEIPAPRELPIPPNVLMLPAVWSPGS